jgi:Heparinase II/III N-terminus
MLAFRHPPRAVLVAVIIAALPAGGITAGAGPETPGPDARAHNLSIVQAPAVVAVDSSESGCLPPSANPVLDGEPIVVYLRPYAEPFTVGQIPASWWKNPPHPDPSWQLALRGFSWVQPLAQRAVQDGQYQSLSALMYQVIAFNTQNPDPGTSQYGWDEGTALRRLETLNCLYWLARAAGLSYGHLSGSMDDNVAVQFGPRYAGPPYRPVHNHGLMANLRILRAGVLRDVASWRTRAMDRMSAEAPLAWSSRGVSWEQSSTYHKVNIDLWDEAAAAIEAQVPSSTTPATIRRYTARAKVVFQWMTEPDGGIVKIGDSDDQVGTPNLRNYATAFRDDQAGWVIGRWSWSDPGTTYYTMRYGPPRRAHGHQDRPCVTFTTMGVRVLVGVGRYTYDTASPWYRWQISPVGQNCSYTDATLTTSRAVSVTGAKVQTTAHAWTTTDTQFGGRTHTRSININGSTHAMRVIDTYTGTGTHRQSFHLDPAWQLVSKSTQAVRFSHPAGRSLRITTSGAVSSVVRGLTNPIAGWVFPRRANRTAAYQVFLRSNTTRLDTTLTVT